MYAIARNDLMSRVRRNANVVPGKPYPVSERDFGSYKAYTVDIGNGQKANFFDVRRNVGGFIWEVHDGVPNIAPSPTQEVRARLVALTERCIMAQKNIDRVDAEIQAVLQIAENILDGLE